MATKRKLIQPTLFTIQNYMAPMFGEWKNHLQPVQIRPERGNQLALPPELMPRDADGQ